MRRALLAATIAALTPFQASAQAPQTVPEADPCVKGRTGDGSPCGTLSEKLNETGGIIRPPAGMDPEISQQAPDPDPGTTPVIPPGQLPPQQLGSDEDSLAVPK
jgi:hypothetical protein